MHVLTFDGRIPSSREEFSVLYFGFVSGCNAARPKDMEARLQESVILQKLWAVSDRPANLPETVTGIRALKMSEERVEFDDAQWTILLARFKHPAVAWNEEKSPVILAVYARLTAAGARTA